MSTEIVKKSMPQLDSSNYLNTLSLASGNNDELKVNIESKAFESALFEGIGAKEVPEDMLKTRVGSNNEELTYFPETYTISELNRLFPGWWTEDMDTVYVPEVRTFMTKGYLCIDYYTLQGKHCVRKMYGVGASYVQSKKDDPTQPVQPDDQAKASVTEWIKIAGKRYGIGLDIYNQIITDNLRSKFEDIVRNWNMYGDEARRIAGTITKPSKFRQLIAQLPTPEQTENFIKAIDGLNQAVAHNFWVNFVKLKREDADAWIEKIKLSIENARKANEAKAKAAGASNNNQQTEGTV